jgi:CubicO group peptidase (beta-lactamase class C family)
MANPLSLRITGACRILQFVITLALLGCASHRASDSIKQTIPHDTNVEETLQQSANGRVVAAWLRGFNTGRPDSMQAAIARLYAPEALERRPAAERVNGLRLWWRNYGRLTPVSVESLSDTAAVINVREGLTDGWGTLYVDLSAGGITGVGMLPFREPFDWSEERIATDAELVAEVERLTTRLVEADAFSGVIMLSRNDEVLLERAYGFADRDARRPNTVATPFELASVGKIFTAVAVAQLAQQNQISFDATIGSVLPDYPPGESASQVTVHHLLTMSSGIPDLFRSPKYWAARAEIRTLADYWPFFAMKPLEFPPGTQWSYSNSNFLILGAMVERVASTPFADAVEQQVFVPAGMTRTTYRSGTVAERARGYTHALPGSAPGAPPDPDQWHPASEENEESKRATGSPAGGGVSTAGDLSRFTRALMNGQLLNRDMAKRVMTGTIDTEYEGRHAYGLETRTWNGVRIVGHGGAFTGVSNQVDFYPDLGYVLVVLGNTDASGTEAIANRVRALIAARSLK